MKNIPYFFFLIIGCFYVKGYAQETSIKWWFDLNDSAFGSAAAGDIDQDGYLEISFGCYRNDSMVYVLNAEDGSLLWKRNLAGDFEGCNDVAPLIYDVNRDGKLEVVVPASCNPTTFCFEQQEERCLHSSHG